MFKPKDILYLEISNSQGEQERKTFYNYDLLEVGKARNLVFTFNP